MKKLILTVVRNEFHKAFTKGEMLFNYEGETPEHLCYTLEDTDRGLSSDMSYNHIIKRKKYGETAIPIGEYKVYKHFWTKHRKHVPGLESVTGFNGILIHSGVTEKDTLGCILVADKIINNVAQNSRAASEKVTELVLNHLASGGEVWIKVDRVAGYQLAAA